MSLTIKDILSRLWTDIKTYISQNYQPKGSYASSDHNHNSAYLGINAKASSASSADSVAWENVSGKPSTFTPSSHTHDDRYYTETEMNTLLGGKSDTSHNHNSAYLGINAKASSSYTTDHISHQSSSDNAIANTYCGNFWSDGSSVFGTGWGGWYSALNSANQDYGSQIFVSENSDRMFFRRLYGSKWYAPLEVIHSGNIGSQSVNYANSSGNADTLDGYHAYQIQTFNSDGSLFGGTANIGYMQWDGSYFWLKTPSNSTACNYSSNSNYANSAGYSNSLSVTTNGSCGITNGGGDVADSLDSGVCNLAIKTWWSIGFYDQCFGKYSVNIDARSGVVRAYTLRANNSSSEGLLLGSYRVYVG